MLRGSVEKHLYITSVLEISVFAYHSDIRIRQYNIMYYVLWPVTSPIFYRIQLKSANVGPE